MSNEIKGIIHYIGRTETFGRNFQKRTFILRIPNDKNSDWDDYVPMCCVRDKVDILDNYREGDAVVCGIDIRGRRATVTENGEKIHDDTKAYADIQAWKIVRPGSNGEPRSRDRFSRPPEREERSASAGSTYRGKGAYVPPRDDDQSDIDF